VVELNKQEMRLLSFFEINFCLKFNEPVRWTTLTEVVFRSAIGFHLHRMCCVLKGQESCASCALNQTCVYSWFFESHIEKDSIAVPGRDRASHPFLLEFDRVSPTEGFLKVVFLGNSRNFIPYVIEAVSRTGVRGVSRDRTQFTVESVLHEGHPYVYNMRETEHDSRSWPDFRSLGKGFIVLDCPCRIKESGKYVSSIDLATFITAMQRRMHVLTCLYGDEPYQITDIAIPSSQPVGQSWKDVNYYSVRQKERIKLGGVVGMIHVKEKPSDSVSRLITAAEYFHIGKNASFGLGKIHYEEEEQ